MSVKRKITPLPPPPAASPPPPPAAPPVPPPDPNRLIRLPDVLRLLPIKKTKWWSMVKDGTAPAPVHLGRCTAWRYVEVVALTQPGGITNG